MLRILKVVTLTLAASALVLTGCAGGKTAETESPAQERTTDFDAYAFYGGQWRGSVSGAGGQTPYGTNNTPEPMLDVFVNEDGTCSVKPLEAHKDLLTEEGTWSATDGSSITLSLPSRDIVLTTIDDMTLEATASDFGIDGFDAMKFALY